MLDGKIVAASTAALALVGEYSREDQLEGLKRAWLAAVARNSANTKAAYGTDLNQWFAWCAARDVDPLAARRVHVDLYADWMQHEQGWVKATWTRKLSAITSFFGYLTDEEIIDANPAAGVKRPKTGQAVPSTLGLDRRQAQALVHAAKEHSPRVYALVVVLLTMGLRISEALNLDISDLAKLHGHRVATITGKGDKTTTEVVPPPAWEALWAYIGERRDGPVFITRTGRRWNRSHVWTLLRRLAQATGVIPDGIMHAHVLRHTAITGLREAGHDIRTVQRFARHASVRTTEIYDHAKQSLDDSLAYEAANWFLGVAGPVEQLAAATAYR